MPRPRTPLIAVCGTSTATDHEMRIAAEVGRLVAERGATVVCGGLTGVMEGAARGAAEAGGQSVGLLPGDDPAAANDYIDLVLATGLGELRNGLIARSCAGMISIGGGYGTLSEIGFMLRLGKPVTCLHSWEVRAPGQENLEAAIHWANDARDAVDWVWQRCAS